VGEDFMIISKKKRNSEEFKRLFCTRPDEQQGELAREDIKRILLNACAKTEHHHNNYGIDIVESDDEIEIVEDDFYMPEDDCDCNFDMGEIEVTDEEIAEYIVENPKEVVVNFPIISDVKLEEKLPFFKSVMYKLANA